MVSVITLTPLVKRSGTHSVITGTRFVDSNTIVSTKAGAKLSGTEYSNTRDEERLGSHTCDDYEGGADCKVDLEKRVTKNKVGLHFCRRYRNLVRYDPNFCKTCSFNGLK